MSLRNFMVIEELSDNDFSIYAPPGQESIISTVRYYSTDKELSSDTLWVIDNENLNRFLEQVSPTDRGLLIATTGHAAECLRQNGAPGGILRCPSGMATEEALSLSQSVLTHYLLWKQNVLTQVLEQQSFAEVLEAAAAPLKNPIAVFDLNMFVLAKSSFAGALPPGTIWDLLNKDQLFISEFYDPEELEAMSQDVARSPQGSSRYHPRKDPEHTYYAQVLKDRGKTIGTLGTVDLFAPLSDGQIAWIDEVVQLLQLYLQYHQSYSSAEVPTSLFLQKVAEKCDLSEEEWNRGLQELHWNENDEFIVGTIYREEPFRTELEKSSYRNLITLMLPVAVCIDSGLRLHIVFRTADYSPDDRFWMEDWGAFLQQNHLSCGISDPFRGLQLLPELMDQSRYASGKAAEDQVPLCRFQEVYRDYLVEALERTAPAESLLHPKVRELAQSEEATLIECLYYYLLNGRNIADTARAMYLHRNTLIYRLEKLEDRLGTDLKTLPEEELLPLMVSCLLLFQNRT